MNSLKGNKTFVIGLTILLFAFLSIGSITTIGGWGNFTSGVTAPSMILNGTPWVDVRSYGAVGDGTTNDTAALQAAVATGRDVYFPNGTYQINATMTAQNNQTLFGDGRGQTIIRKTNNNSNIVFTVSSKQNVVIRDMTIDLNRSENTSSKAIAMSSSRNVTVSNVEVLNIYGFGIIADGSSDGKIVNSYFNGNTNYNDGNSGIGIWYANTATTNLLIQGNTFKDLWINGIYGSGKGTRIKGNSFFNVHRKSSVGGGMVDIDENGENTVISGNSFYNASSTGAGGVEIHNSNRTTVIGNTMLNLGSSAACVSLGGTAGTVLENLISSNTCINTGNGIEVNAGITNFSIVGNVVADSAKGINVIFGAGNYFLIANNYLSNNTADLTNSTTQIKNVTINNYCSGVLC